jgi:hypothetical protein
MIKFKHEEYGKVIIYESDDISWSWREFSNGKLDVNSFRGGSRSDAFTASVIGFRNLEKNYVELLKNRYGSLKDLEMELFILTYHCKKEIFEPIDSRFDILDL